MQIYSQNAHHLVKGNTFQQDHDFFGSVYEELVGDYDDVAERIIGLYGEEPLNLQEIMTAVCVKIANAPSTGTSENKVFYQYQLTQEETLCKLIEKIIKTGVYPGTEQLIGEIANKSEARKYKIKQRLK